MAKGRKKRGYGRKMAQGECRTTRKGVEYCRTRAGVRFTGRMADIGFDDMADLGKATVMTPGECKTVHTKVGTRQLCYTSAGARFVPMSMADVAELAAYRRQRAHKARARR